MTMKSILTATLAGLLLVGGLAQAHAARDVDRTSAAQTAPVQRRQTAANPLGLDNPTALPSFEMRPDGLMINGLLPAPGWQG